jgi:hypothetical protein
MADCAVCREDIAPRTKCPRCGYDNGQLQEVNEMAGYFGSFWGILSFLLIFPPLFMIMPGVFTIVNEILQPVISIRVGGPISLLITLITTFYMFGASKDLHHYTLTRRFKKNPGRHIALWALIFFVVAILLAFLLSFVVVNKDAIVGPEGYPQMEEYGKLTHGGPWHMLLKLAMTGTFVLMFTFFALSAGMMAAYLHGRYMEDRRPDPIFLNEELLIKVVLDTVREQLGNPPDMSTLGMKRLENAGISLNLLQGEKLTTQGGKVVQKEKTWLVCADCWGRVNKIEEKSARLLQSP